MPAFNLVLGLCVHENAGATPFTSPTAIIEVKSNLVSLTVLSFNNIHTVAVLGVMTVGCNECAVPMGCAKLGVTKIRDRHI